MAGVIQPPTTPPPSSAASRSLLPLPTLLFLFPSAAKTPLYLPKSNSRLILRRRRVFCSASTAQPLVASPPSLAGTQFAKRRKRSASPRYDAHKSRIKLLLMSAQFGDVELAKAVHALIAKAKEHLSLWNALIAAYLKLGFVLDAYYVFSGLSSPNRVSYNRIIFGFAKSRREMEAVRLFFRMRSSGIEPDGYSFVAVLTACNRIMMLQLGLQVHAFAVKMGKLGSVPVSNALMGLYSKCGCSDYALQLFDEMRERDIVSWNTVLSSLVRGSMYERAFELFRYMQRIDGYKVDYFTISTLMSACTSSVAAAEGRELHAYAIKHGLGGHLDVSNTLLGFYIKCGSLEDADTLFKRMPFRDVITSTEMMRAHMEFGSVDLAVKIFDSMPTRNLISYNAMLAGYCHNGEGQRALTLFIRMVEDGMELSEFTLTSIISACGLLGDGEISKQVQAFVSKFGFGSNYRIESALLDMCRRCGRSADAEKMFGRGPSDQDRSIDWTSMISGYVLQGQLEEAVHLFHQFQSEGTLVIDCVVATTMLGVCGNLGFHEMGKQIHCYALKHGFVSDLRVGNSLISMYAKCFNMDDSVKAFNVMPMHHAVSWNCLIAGYILHRKGDEALAVKSKIEKACIKPDALTLVLLISAYRHTSLNLVDDCRRLFHSMETIYGIEPDSDHYASLISVLGYWGYLEEAEEMVNKMPFEPTPSIWRSLLDSCRIHLNTTLGKQITKRILELKPQHPSTYRLAANLYSISGRFICSEMVREEMREKGIQKQPVRSWVILQNTVQSFYTRDKSHSLTEDIYIELERLIPKCLKAGYIPDMSFVLQDVDEHQKKDFLFYHSAKLAASYGLLMAEPGKPVHIAKNVKLCGDCHSFLKFVSVVTRRKILLRDVSGFHCFENGKCSCKDFW